MCYHKKLQHVFLFHLAHIIFIIQLLIQIVFFLQKCDNHWIDKYLAPKGPVTSVLLTYDDPRVDHVTFHQWPLGVAT